MQQRSSTSWPNYKNPYYNPVYKIRSLVQTLDAELAALTRQCAIKKLELQNPSPNHLKQSYVLGHSASGRKYSVKNEPSKGMAVLNGGDLVLPPTSTLETRALANNYRSRVIDAFRNRRIFTVYGNYHTVRRALLNRGWLEKMAPNRYPKLQSLPEEVLLQHAKRGNDYEAVAISKIISHFPAFFIWQPKGMRDEHTDVLPLRNRVRRGRSLDFSTKIGLIGCAQQAQWFCDEGNQAKGAVVCGMSHPRFYRLGGGVDAAEERMAFIEDYRQTQCRCLLKHILENIQRGGVAELADPEAGAISIAAVQFAVTQLKRQYDELEHRTLDVDETEAQAANAALLDLNNVEWCNFIQESNEIIRTGAKIKANASLLEDVAKLSRMYLTKLEERRRDYKWDGCRNLWILKPGYQCRGLGIIIRSSLEEILQWASNNTQRRYIVQKYLERPLLIHKTKFDIRQYMLITIGESTLSIWLYKDCYLRFSSQEFTIEDLRESIHLTNNSIQKHYKNKPSRDARLPKHNMWTLEQFKLHLKQTQAPENVWEQHIYPGFKANLIAVVMASLEETQFIENSFELYGCDLMLDEEYNPILIEINATPDLTPSTEVTARLCPLVLKDLVKVVLDLPQNAQAPTGNFERVYEVNYKFRHDYDAELGLDVCGKQVTLFKPLKQQNVRKFVNRSSATTSSPPMKMLKKTENHVNKVPMKRLRRQPTVREKSKPQNDARVSAEPKVLEAAAKKL